MDIVAAVCRETGAPFAIERLTLEAPRAHEVLVRVVATGICHTDLGMRNASDRVPKPIVLGHEGAGIVEAVGSAVTRVKPGDNVVMTFNTCGACRSCLQGDSAYCRHLPAVNFSGGREDGTTGLSDSQGPVHSHFFGQSSFATHALCSERNVIPAPADIPLDILGPLGCGIQTGAGAILNALKPGPESRIAILGAGSVGLSAVMAAKLVGCRHITVVDIKPARLALAASLGATHTINALEQQADAEVRTRHPDGLDMIVDTTGHIELIRQLIDTLGPRGVCGLISTAKGADLKAGILHMVLNGIQIRGIHQGDSQPQIFIPQLIDYYRRGDFPFDRLIQFYELADINQAMMDMAQDRVIKPVIRMPG